jgi:hypothetical protein
MSHLFLPSDPALKRLAAAIEEERNHALMLEPGVEEGPEVERVQSEPGEAFRALYSSARREENVLTTTAPDGTLSLFGGEPAPAPLAAAEPEPVAVPEETKSQRRARLREERTALVTALTRLTGEPHRAIHGRINRATGAASVTAASSAQLEKGNRLLEREVAKRR